MGTIGLCVQFEQEILKFNGWRYFWWDMGQCAPKMLNLQQEMQWSRKEIILNQMNKLSLFLTVLIEMLYIVKQWTSTCSNSSTTLLNMTFVSKYGCICNFVPWGKNLSNCLVLGISWLRPTSNNTKHTPWDPLVYKSWVSKVLCLIPDSVSSWGLSRKRTWCMHENPFL